MRLRSALLLAALPLSLVACGSDSADDAAADSTVAAEAGGASADADGPRVVASTAWTGALAQLAGAGQVDVIAPTSILHPPDYDPKPSDLAVAAEADLVVYAEFESFATRLTEAAGSDATTFAINLVNSPANIEAEVLRLAEELGTTEVARENLDTFLAEVTALGEKTASNVPDPAPVIVSQIFVPEWVEWAGLTSVGTYGPQPMSAGDLASLMEFGPTLVFDNHHMPGGQAFEAEGTPRIELLNYPGDDLDLLAVFRHNHELIVKALTGGVTADTSISVPEGGSHGHGDSGSAHGDSGSAHGDSTTETTATGHGDADSGHGHGDAATETTVTGHGHGEATTDTSGHGG